MSQKQESVPYWTFTFQYSGVLNLQTSSQKTIPQTQKSESGGWGHRCKKGPFRMPCRVRCRSSRRLKCHPQPGREPKHLDLQGLGTLMVGTKVSGKMGTPLNPSRRLCLQIGWQSSPCQVWWPSFGIGWVTKGALLHGIFIFLPLSRMKATTIFPTSYISYVIYL